MRVALVRSAEPARAAVADDPLVEVLERRGVTVSRPCWDDPAVDWDAADVVVVRTTWDYAGRREEFLGWADDVGARVPLLNAPQVLRWNTHKSYLIELEERGAPVVPTAWLGRGDRVSVAEVLASRGWDRALAKPAVGVGGTGIVRLSADTAAQDQAAVDALLERGDVLVQPFLASVTSAGELSVVVVDGEVTHAVRKRPGDGEYRVQEERGAHHERVEPSGEAVELARWLVEATGLDLLFARVDLLEDDLGALQLVELEATEPDLYLGLGPEGATALADALERRAGSA